MAPPVQLQLDTEVCECAGAYGGHWTALSGTTNAECERLARRLGVRVGIKKGKPALEGTHDARRLRDILND